MTADNSTIIREIDDIRSKLRHVLAAPNRWGGVLRRNTFARAIQGSNSIEGIHVSTEDAIAAIEGEEPSETDRETFREILGYRDAMTYVLRLATDPHFSYSDALIKGLHYMVLKHNLTKNPGMWRPGSIYVRDESRGVTVYEGPAIDSVPELVTELVLSLNVSPPDAPALVRAAMGHLNLVMIHPFSDGNGRMARILQTLILGREGIIDPRFSSIEEYLGRNTTDYYSVLARVGEGAWNPENSARPWVEFCLIAHFNQATTLLRRTRETERVWDELESLVKHCGFPERTIYALSDAAFGYKVRNSSYRAAADINDTLASKDLKVLVDAGFLLSDGEKRGRFYVASNAIREIRERNREAKSVYRPSAPESLFLPGMDPQSSLF
ncbi:MAG: Fic family protein [Chthonomonadales bacterium]